MGPIYARHEETYACVRQRQGEKERASGEREKVIDVAGEYMTVEDSGDVVIVTSGVAYNYVKEAVKRLKIRAVVVKLGMSVPVPQKVAELAKSVVVSRGGRPRS
jgi:indolepyruvate ferredoxin oxidoreductase alpha subunit